MVGSFHAVLNINWLFLKLNGSFVTNCRFSAIIEPHTQWSRLKPSCEFHFEGLSNFSLPTKTLVQNQDVNPRI